MQQPDLDCTITLLELLKFLEPCLKREIKRVQKHNRRARKLGKPGTLTVMEWLRTLHTWRWCCAYCQRNPAESIDHVIPLSVPDSPGTTQTNCVPCCIECNMHRNHVFQEGDKLVEMVLEYLNHNDQKTLDIRSRFTAVLDTIL